MKLQRSVKSLMVRLFNYPSGLTFGVISLLAFSLFSTQIIAQSSPSKIRGYKVHNAEVFISTDPDDIDENVKGVLVDFEDPVVSGFSLTGVTFDVRASVTSFSQSGTIDFITFKDFKINGISIEIAEFNKSFSLPRGNPVSFLSPIKVFVNGIEGTKALIGEIRGSENQWRITGRAFVFGKFKKGIFKFKRVIPMNIDLTIEKPSVKIPYVNTRYPDNFFPIRKNRSVSHSAAL